jgi:hypothetical protein
MPAPPQRQHRIRVMTAAAGQPADFATRQPSPAQQIALSDRDGWVHSRCLIAVAREAAVLGAI